MALEQVGSHGDDILDPWYALEKRTTGGLNEGNHADRKEAGNKKEGHLEPGNRMNMIALAGQQAGRRPGWTAQNKIRHSRGGGNGRAPLLLLTKTQDPERCR